MVLKSQEVFDYPSLSMKTGVSVPHLVECSAWPLQPLLEADPRGGHYSQLDIEHVLKTICYMNDKNRMNAYAKAVLQGKENIDKACRDWAYTIRVMLSHVNLQQQHFVKLENVSELHPPEMQNLYSLITEATVGIAGTTANGYFFGIAFYTPNFYFQ